MLYALGLAAMALAWLLPGHFHPYTAFQQDMLSAAGAVLLALAAALDARHWPVRVPRPALFALALAIVPCMQWLLGLLRFATDAVLPAGYLAAFALTVVASACLAAHRTRFVPAALAAVALAATTSVAIGLVQWLGLGPMAFVEPWTPGDRIVANLTQPNQLACLLGLGVVAVAWCFERRVVGVATTAVLAGFLSIGLALTQSRAAWLMVVAVVGVWALLRRRLSLRLTTGGIVLAVACMAAAALARAPLHALWSAGAAPSLAGVELRAPVNLRVLHWQTLWDALLREPWLGYGWLQAAAAQQAAALDHPATYELLSAAHNQALDLLIWNGLPIGLLALGAIAWWFVDRLRRCSDVDGWAALAALAVLAAHSAVEFPLQYAYFLLPAAVLVGIVEARAAAAQPPPKAGLSAPRPVFLAALLGMTGLLYVLWGEYLEVEEAVRQVRQKYEARIVHKDLDPKAPDGVVLLDAQREYVRLWTTEARAGMPPEQLDWMRDVARRFPAPGALDRYAFASALNGRTEEALRALRLMCRMAQPWHCDRGRQQWAQRALAYPALNAVPYPATPALQETGPPR